MSAVFISGYGAVSPAGWDLAAMRDALAKGQLLPCTDLPRPGADIRQTPRAMRVPPPNPRPAFLTHSRLRRASPLTQFAVSAALQALGPRQSGTAGNIGVIVCIFSGCVNYSRRFFDETLKDPSTASPLIFPETVFNAPASHISAYLGSTAINYTLVGDVGTLLVGLATAARWLLEDRVEECLLVGAEEADWLTTDALRLFDRKKCLSEGAGAVLLTKSGDIRLESVTDEFLYSTEGKQRALQLMRKEVGNTSPSTLLVDSTAGEQGISLDEARFWSDWTGPRLSPKSVLGEGLMASAAWQLVTAVDALHHRTAPEAIVSIAGFHQHTVAARLAL